MKIKLKFTWTSDGTFGRLYIYKDLRPREPTPMWHYSGAFYGTLFEVMSFSRALFLDDTVDVVSIGDMTPEEELADRRKGIG